MEKPPIKGPRQFEGGSPSLPIDKDWDAFSKKINAKNLPKLEEKINSGNFSAEEIFTEGIKEHWREGFYLLGFRNGKSLSSEAFVSLMERMPKEMLKSIFTQINADEFQLLEKKIGADKVAELVAKIFLDLAGNEMRILDSKLSSLVSVKLAERTKTEEEEATEGETEEELSGVEPQEPIDLGIEDSDIKDLKKIDKTTESVVVLKPEDEVVENPDNEDTQEMEIQRLGDEDAGNETREFEIPTQGEVGPEDLKIGELVEDIRKRGGIKIKPLNLEKGKENIVADLQKFLEFLTEVNESPDTVAFDEPPAIVISHGYEVTPDVISPLRPDNEQEYESEEETDEIFRNIQRTEEEIAQAKQNKKEKYRSRVEKIMKDEGLSEEGAKERISAEKRIERGIKNYVAKETTRRFIEYLERKYGKE